MDASGKWPAWRLVFLVIIPTAALSCSLTMTYIRVTTTDSPLVPGDNAATGNGEVEEPLRSVDGRESPEAIRAQSAASQHGGRAGAVDVTSSRFLIAPYISTDQVFGPLKWKQLGPSVQSEILLGGKVALISGFYADTEENSSPVWTDATIDAMVSHAKSGNHDLQLSTYGPRTNLYFFNTLKQFPVEGKSVLIIGSRNPWVEAICLAYGAKHVTTVDFNPPLANYSGLTIMSLADLDKTTERYQAVFSYSSLEHDGLGRYGDPIHPNGDLERMKKIRGLVAEGGLLYLGVPNGNDSVVFNAHRIYGPIRFPMLIDGWNVLGTFGMTLEQAYKLQPGQFDQPLHVLSLKP